MEEAWTCVEGPPSQCRIKPGVRRDGKKKKKSGGRRPKSQLFVLKFQRGRSLWVQYCLVFVRGFLGELRGETPITRPLVRVGYWSTFLHCPENEDKGQI